MWEVLICLLTLFIWIRLGISNSLRFASGSKIQAGLKNTGRSEEVSLCEWYRYWQKLLLYNKLVIIFISFILHNTFYNPSMVQCLEKHKLVLIYVSFFKVMISVNPEMICKITCTHFDTG